jgi:D-alanyl-D-alanine carboxypeptidase
LAACTKRVGGCRRIGHDGATRRRIHEARAIPVRGRRTPRLPRSYRAPVAGLLISLLTLLAPELTLAPTLAGDAPAATPAALRWLGAQPPLPLSLPRLDDRRTAGGPTAPDVAAATEVVDAEAFQRALDAARADGKAFGITFALVRDGRLVWSGASGNPRDAGPALAPDSPMVIGSVTKTFVAAAILQLVEEGSLALDDRVRDHLPELRQVSRRITVRQLLDHTSGLADLFNDATRRGLEEEPSRAWTSDEVLETLHAPWYRPGEGWAYANTNYFLLGMIVERISGAPLAEVLTDRFLAPLELAGTRTLTGVAGDPLEPAWTTIFWASGAMAAPAADLARWGDALYGDGLLGEPSRSAMLDVNDHDYGLGVQRLKVGRVKGYGHTGLLNTYTTLLFHVPREDVTIALLVNRSHVELGAMLKAEPRRGPSLLELALGD